ncbi:hypothetical protein THAOC_19516, partial [Thalassiosira oceanica]
MSSTPVNEYLQFLADEREAEEAATAARVSAVAQISSVIASLAASSAGLLKKRKADCDNTGSNFLGRDRGAKTIKRERLDMEPYIEKMEERPFRRKY